MARVSQKARERTISELASIGVGYDDAVKLLRIGTTMQRLAEAACNGDWPADNGERKVKACPKCEGPWVASSFVKGVCPSCRIDQRAEEAAAKLNLVVELNGDPRGGVFAVIKPGGIAEPARKVWVS